MRTQQFLAPLAAGVSFLFPHAARAANDFVCNGTQACSTTQTALTYDGTSAAFLVTHTGTSGDGISASIDSTSNSGVAGHNTSVGGNGVYGIANGAGGIGVYGVSSGNIGVEGSSSASGGLGVAGFASGTGGQGGTRSPHSWMSRQS
jgi:hypothetical protein